MTVKHYYYYYYYYGTHTSHIYYITTLHLLHHHITLLHKTRITHRSTTHIIITHTHTLGTNTSNIMSKYQPPKTAAIGVPKQNKEYYMHLVPGGSLELNVGEYDYGWYACKCVAVTGKTDDDCAFVVEFEEAYKDTRFQKGWKFDDPMEQNTFDNISDNGRCLFYYGLLTKEDGFFVRSTEKNTAPYVTTAVLKKQQRRDETL